MVPVTESGVVLFATLSSRVAPLATVVSGSAAGSPEALPERLGIGDFQRTVSDKGLARVGVRSRQDQDGRPGFADGAKAGGVLT